MSHRSRARSPQGVMSGACGHLPVRGGMIKLHCPAPVLAGGPRSDMAPIFATGPHSVRGYTQTKARPNTPWYLATEVPVGSRQPGMAPVSVTGQHSTRRHQQTHASFASLRHFAARGRPRSHSLPGSSQLHKALCCCAWAEGRCCRNNAQSLDVHPCRTLPEDGAR